MKRGIDQTMAWVIAILLGCVVYGGGTMAFVKFGTKRVEAESADGDQMSSKAHHGKAKAGEDEAEEHGTTPEHSEHSAKAGHDGHAAKAEHGEEHGVHAAKAEHGEEHEKSDHEKTVKADNTEHGDSHKSGEQEEKHH